MGSWLCQVFRCNCRLGGCKCRWVGGSGVGGSGGVGPDGVWGVGGREFGWVLCGWVSGTMVGWGESRKRNEGLPGEDECRGWDKGGVEGDDRRRWGSRREEVPGDVGMGMPCWGLGGPEVPVGRAGNAGTAASGADALSSWLPGSDRVVREDKVSLVRFSYVFVFRFSKLLSILFLERKVWKQYGCHLFQSPSPERPWRWSCAGCGTEPSCRAHKSGGEVPRGASPETNTNRISLSPINTPLPHPPTKNLSRTKNTATPTNSYTLNEVSIP